MNCEEEIWGTEKRKVFSAMWFDKMNLELGRQLKNNKLFPLHIL